MIELVVTPARVVWRNRPMFLSMLSLNRRGKARDENYAAVIVLRRVRSLLARRHGIVRTDPLVEVCYEPSLRGWNIWAMWEEAPISGDDHLVVSRSAGDGGGMPQ